MLPLVDNYAINIDLFIFFGQNICKDIGFVQNHHLQLFEKSNNLFKTNRFAYVATTFQYMQHIGYCWGYIAD